jgi:hypothetical protein
MHHFLGILEIEFFEKIIVNVYVIKKYFAKTKNNIKALIGFQNADLKCFNNRKD